MKIKFDEDWFIHTYDDVLGEAGGALPVGKLRDEVAGRYADAVAAGQFHSVTITEFELGQLLYDMAVRPARSKRKKQFKRDLDWIVDSITNPDEGILIEPILSAGYPVGDGTDKALRYWLAEDFARARVERYRNASDVMAAARDFDEAADRVIAQIERAGVITVGDLFRGDR